MPGAVTSELSPGASSSVVNDHDWLVPSALPELSVMLGRQSRGVCREVAQRRVGIEIGPAGRVVDDGADDQCA